MQEQGICPGKQGKLVSIQGTRIPGEIAMSVARARCFQHPNGRAEFELQINGPKSAQLTRSIIAWRVLSRLKLLNYVADLGELIFCIKQHLAREDFFPSGHKQDGFQNFI